MLEFLYRPQESISYSFILGSYLLCSALCLLLLALEYGAQLDSVKGFWVVFAPFLPCVLWAAAMKRQAELPRDDKAKQE